MLRSVFGRFLALTGGSVAGQLLMVLVLPIATRLYDPADFGLLGAFSSLVMIVLPAACLRFDLAIPVVESDHDARALAVLGAGLSLAVSLAVWVLLKNFELGLGDEIAEIVRGFGWLIVLTIWSGALFSVAQYWAIRQKRYGALAMSHAVRGATGASTQVALGAMGTGTFGLIFGQAVYIGIGAVGLLVSFLRKEAAHLRDITKPQLRHVARREWRYPLLATPQALLNSAGVYLPTLLIVSFVGAKEGGVFYLAQRLTSIPVALVGGNLSRVFLGEAPERLKRGELFSFTFGIWRILVLVGVVAGGIGALALQALAGAVFGSEWTAAADVVTLLLPAAVMQFAVVPVSMALYVLSLQGIALVLQVAGLILQVGPILLSHWTGWGDPVMAFAAGAAVQYVIYNATVMLAVRRRA